MVKQIGTPQFIKHIRNTIGQTQEQFARYLGVTVVTVNRWENAKTVPSPLAMQRIRELAESVGLVSGRQHPDQDDQGGDNNE